MSGSGDPVALEPDASSDQSGDEPDRALIDQLIADTALYNTAEQQKDLMDFVVRFRRMAPFNAMLLHIQKPGLSYAASIRDWQERFNRYPKEDARPLLIMRTFGPVDLVYDILDTEGDPLPDSAWSFPAKGKVDPERLQEAYGRLKRQDIICEEIDQGDNSAGYVRIAERRNPTKEKHLYRLALNKNHPPETRFVTLLHELGHLLLGHLGEDPKRKVKDRTFKTTEVMEVEAESVAYLVARRHGVKPRSESYLDHYKGSFDEMDMHAVMKVAGQIEKLLNLSPVGDDFVLAGGPVEEAPSPEAKPEGWFRRLMLFLGFPSRSRERPD